MTAEPSSALYIGVLSGTSMDGIDVVAARFQPQLEVVAAMMLPFAQALPSPLHQLSDAAIAELDQHLGEQFAEAVLRLITEHKLDRREIAAIGSHGQTIRHAPPISLQVGCAQTIADRTGLTTIANFRAADLQAGGQGAPLAPLLHQALWANRDEPRAVLNLGGIANLTLLPTHGPVCGWDTGPANCLLDAWHRRHAPGHFDRNGERASRGHVQATLLQRLLTEPYFQQAPPKSTGPDQFSEAWLDNHLGQEDWAVEDVQATLAELTAVTVADALRQAPADQVPQRLILCGGGSHNPDLLARLQAQHPNLPMQPSTDLGVNVDGVEALLFAWLAQQRLANLALDTAPITGATRPVRLGDVFEPRAGRD